MHCNGCGTTKAYKVLTRADSSEVCNECGHVVDNSPRDANGNKVKVPLSEQGRFSYATGTPILGSRQYADVLKRSNLAQKEA